MTTFNPKDLRPDEQVMYHYAETEASKFARLCIMALLQRLRGKTEDPPLAAPSKDYHTI